MNLNETVIGFSHYRIRCIIGVHLHEKECEQDIFVDLKVSVDPENAVKTDHLSETIDYVALSNLCKELAVEGRFCLLETYVSSTLKAILQQFPIQWAWMRVEKPAALPGATCAYVEMRLNNG